MARCDRIDRVAMLSVHTSPLEQPGTGDAGGLNVYVVEVARQLARRDVEVEIFTRTTTAELPPTVELEPGVLVRHVTAGPYEGLGKDDLPGQLCAFTAGVMRSRGQRHCWNPTPQSPLACRCLPVTRSARHTPMGREVRDG